MKKCHINILNYKILYCFSLISERLYNLYNTEAFEGCLPQKMDIIWDPKLTKTAGTCSQGGKIEKKSGKVIERTSSIKLSIKVNKGFNNFH